MISAALHTMAVYFYTSYQYTYSHNFVETMYFPNILVLYMISN